VTHPARLALTSLVVLLAASGCAEPNGPVPRAALAGRPFALAVSPAGVVYVTLLDASHVARLDLSGAVTGTATVGATPSSLVFDGAGERVYVGDQGGRSIHVIDVATNRVVDSLPFGGAVTGLAVAPGDSMLLVGTDAGKVYFVQLPSLTVADSVLLPPIMGGGPLAPLQFTNAMAIRDTLVYASCPYAGIVAVINLRRHQLVATLDVGGVPQELLVAPSGAELYLANEIGELQVISLTTRTLARTVTMPGGGGFGLARNPADGLLYVTTSYFGRNVVVVDPAAGSVVRVITTDGVPRRIAFTPTGSAGAVANEDGWVDFLR
jgi:YVTN family beta-propeller protein